MTAQPKRRGGRPPFKPTAKQRESVQIAIACGMTHRQIASCVGIDVNTLEKHFRVEIDNGFDAIYEKIAGNLVRKALDGNLTAQTFWLKTKAGWRETNRVENTGADGGPLQVNVSGQVTVYIPHNGRDAPPEDAKPDAKTG